MKNSANRREKARRRSVAGGAMAVAGQAVARNPVLVGGATAFLLTLFYVSANALWYQPHRHDGVFFKTRVQLAPPPARGAEASPVPAANPAPRQVTTEAAPPPAVQGDPKVEEVQRILADLSLYTGTVDGLTGPQTRKAIAAYREAAGLPAGEEIDEALLEALGRNEPRSVASIPVPVPRGGAAEAPAAVSQDAAAQADIMRIQAGLRAFGHETMELDGVVGARTRAAILEFQGLFGLPRTGEPDAALALKMREIGLID